MIIAAVARARRRPICGLQTAEDRISHGASFLAPGSLARQRPARLIHHHHADCGGLDARSVPLTATAARRRLQTSTSERRPLEQPGQRPATCAADRWWVRVGVCRRTLQVEGRREVWSGAQPRAYIQIPPRCHGGARGGARARGERTTSQSTGATGLKTNTAETREAPPYNAG